MRGVFMIQTELDLKVKFLKGFADKTRIQILDCLRHGEMTVTEIVQRIDGNQSNVSQHLNCLKGCGIISGRQEGKYVYYALRNEQVGELLNMFDVVFSQVGAEVGTCKMNVLVERGV